MLGAEEGRIRAPIFVWEGQGRPPRVTPCTVAGRKGVVLNGFLTLESPHLMVLVPLKSGGLADRLRAGKS